jgi:hypothetical protein
MQAVPNTPAPPQPVNIGLEITKDLVKVFQNHLDARRWRGVRFCVSCLFLLSPYYLTLRLTCNYRLRTQLHMFAHLATLPKPLISITSLLSLLNQSFIFVLENEFSLRAERGDELVKVVLETLLRIPAEKLQGQNEALEAIKSGLSNYMNSRELDLSFLGDKVNESQWLDVSLFAKTAFGNSDRLDDILTYSGLRTAPTTTVRSIHVINRRSTSNSIETIRAVFPIKRITSLHDRREC